MIDRTNERKRDWWVSGGLPLTGCEWEVIGVGKVNSDKLAQPSARLALFFPYSHLPSMDELLSPMDELLSPMDELEFEPPSATDEPPSPLLKSRIPRKTVIRVFDRNM